MECVNSGLCIFDQTLLQDSIKRTYDLPYYPISSISENSPIEFVVRGSTEEYIDCDHIFIQVDVKILKEDGTNIDSSKDIVAFCNLPIACIFSDVFLTISETQVEGGDGKYPYKAYNTTVMQYDKAVQKSHLTIQGWYRDQAGKMDDKANTGFVKRMEMTKDSRVWTLKGPVHLDFFKQSRYLISQTPMRLKFNINSAACALMAPGMTDKYKFQITDACLFVRRCVMAPSVINGHAKGLLTRNALYPELHTQMIDFTIPAGELNYTKEGLYLTELPRVLTIHMVDNETFNGKQTSNMFNYQHYNLNYMNLYVNGNSVLGYPLKPNFDNSNYVNAYATLMDTYHYLNTGQTNGLTYEEFGEGFSLFAFDLTADRSLTSNYKDATSASGLRLELHFAKKLPSTINVIMQAVFDSSLEVTNLRDVIVNYLR